MNKNHPKSYIYLSCLIIMLLVSRIPDLAQAQTPLPKLPPKLTIRWLDSLTVDPTPVRRGDLKSVTATLALMRPAATSMEIILELSGGHSVRGMQHSSCVWTYYRVYVNPGDISKSFPIFTGSYQIRAGTPETLVPKNFTFTARYGSESVSASFTVNCPQ
jgi:hypothetical protein